MLALIAVLTPIALIDSTSLVPLAVVPLLLLLGGKRPVLGVASFLLSIFISYLLCGIVLLVGIESVFKQISATIHRVWSDPSTLELYLQIAIGVLLAVFGYRLAIPKSAEKKVSTVQSMSPGQAILFGVGFTIAGLWGALPYFAAIDQILQNSFPTFENIVVLIYYNVIFISPLLTLVIARFIWRERSEPLFHMVSRMLSLWGRRLIVVILVLLGLTLIADGIGWLLGHPLLPLPT